MFGSGYGIDRIYYGGFYLKEEWELNEVFGKGIERMRTQT